MHGYDSWKTACPYDLDEPFEDETEEELEDLDEPDTYYEDKMANDFVAYGPASEEE
jgi:hypothetical protein